MQHILRVEEINPLTNKNGGILQETVTVHGRGRDIVTVYNMGGHRRADNMKKWIHQFEDVNYVIFHTRLTAYDENTPKDLVSLEKPVWESSISDYDRDFLQFCIIRG